MKQRLLAGLVLISVLASCSSSHHGAQSKSRGAVASCPGSAAGGSGVLAITLPCLGDGPKVDLAGLRGSPTIVTLWASWCDHCPEEARALQAVYARAGGRLRVVGVDTEDDQGHAYAFVHDLGVHYPSVFDSDGNFRRRLKLPGPPATLFVDANGHLVQRIFGPLDVNRLNTYVADYLGVRL